MRRFFLLVALLLSAAALQAQAPLRKIKISFLPPPGEGTISLGIYDAKGTLVRVLQREAEIEDFEAGHDSLITYWDGNNDAGQPLPPGKYHARGFAVDANVEGVGYYFNDWVTDEDSLRLARISAIDIENGVPLLTVTLVDGRTLSLLCDANAHIMNTGEARPRSDKCEDAGQLSCAVGRDNTRWVIEHAGEAATEVKQFSPDGELLRRLSIPLQDPQPMQIAASRDGDTILLLEENAVMQRLRSLTLVTTQGGNSEWKVDFEKKIMAHRDFAVENGKPVTGGGTPPTDRILVKLQPNPLQNDARGTLELFVGFDNDGSFLRTADGLPLQSISETPNLKRIVLAPAGENRIDIFQDDGAVVEQFRAKDLGRMMAFDAGEFELR